MVFTLSWASFLTSPYCELHPGWFLCERGPSTPRSLESHLAQFGQIPAPPWVALAFFISGLALSMYAQVLCDSLDLGSE